MRPTTLFCALLPVDSERRVVVLSFGTGWLEMFPSVTCMPLGPFPSLC
jgi:hypothetical protein